MSTPYFSSIKRTQAPAVKELVGLPRCAGKRPDWATLISWTKGKSMAQDVTVRDTFAECHAMSATVSEQGGAAKQAADNRSAMYHEIEDILTFSRLLSRQQVNSCSRQAVELRKRSGDTSLSSTTTAEKQYSCFTRSPRLCREEMRSHSYHECTIVRRPSLSHYTLC